MSGTEDLQFVPGSEFKIRWNIKKFSFFGAKENNSLKSKTVVVPSLNNTEWYLKLICKGPPERSIMCFLCRTNTGPENIKIFYAISVGSSYAVEFQMFGKESTSVMPGVINQEKFISNVSRGLINDVLHIECHLWMHTDSNADSQTRAVLVSPYPASISMTTEIEVENRSFFMEVENFSNEHQMVNVCLASAFHGALKLVFRFWTNDQDLKVILREQEDSAQGQLFVLNCNIQFLDIFKKRHLLFSGRGVFNSKGDGSDKTWNFPLSMLKKELVEKKELYLPNDVLLLECKFEVATNVSVCLTESTIYDTSDAKSSDHNFQWGMYLDHVYNKHRFLFRLLAFLVVVLSVLPHLFSDNSV